MVVEEGVDLGEGAKLNGAGEMRKGGGKSLGIYVGAVRLHGVHGEKCEGGVGYRVRHARATPLGQPQQRENCVEVGDLCILSHAEPMAERDEGGAKCIGDRERQWTSLAEEGGDEAGDGHAVLPDGDSGLVMAMEWRVIQSPIVRVSVQANVA